MQLICKCPFRQIFISSTFLLFLNRVKVTHKHGLKFIITNDKIESMCCIVCKTTRGAIAGVKANYFCGQFLDQVNYCHGAAISRESS